MSMGGRTQKKTRRKMSGGSEMSLELFVFIVVVGVASGLIYAVAIAK